MKSSAVAYGTSGKGGHDAKSIFTCTLAVSTGDFYGGIFGFAIDRGYFISHNGISH
jgi:hypothetical protein